MAVPSAVAISNVTPPADAGADRVTVKVNVVVPALPSLNETSLMLRNGSGACTVVTAVAALFEVFESVVVDVTDAVFEMVEPLPPFAVATSAIVADAPLASEVKLTVRFLPEPPHTPPRVDEQDTKVIVSGRLSVTTTD